MIKVGVGISSEHDAFIAGRDAAKDALTRLGSLSPIGGLVFASLAFDQDQFLSGVCSVLPEVPLAGGSTAGEVSTEGLARESSGVVMLFASNQLRLASSAVHHLLANPKGSGGEFVRRSQELLPSVHHALLFLDPFIGDIQAFLSGCTEAKETFHGMTGVGVGDDLLYRETYQYRDKAAHTRSATALLFGGSCTIATASTHGFIPVGMPERVTESKGNSILSLGERKAVELYKSYFGEKHMDLLTTNFSETTAVYPLGVKTDQGYVVHIPTALTKQGGIEFLEHIPEGSDVRLMVGDIDATIEGAKDATRKLIERLGGRTLCGLVIFSSAARRVLLGSRADDEIRAIQDIVGAQVPIAGMYGYAEILGSPPTCAQATMTLWGIAE